MQDMKNVVLKIVNGYPELHYKMGLVFNSSSPSKAESQSQVPQSEGGGGAGEGGAGGGGAGEGGGGGGGAGGGGAGGGGDEESLLSDEIMDTLAKDLSKYIAIIIPGKGAEYPHAQPQLHGSYTSKDDINQTWPGCGLFLDLRALSIPKLTNKTLSLLSRSATPMTHTFM